MTVAEALEIARQAKPLPRAVIRSSYGDAALAKLAAPVAAITKQLDWARAGIALVADAKSINITETVQ